VLRKGKGRCTTAHEFVFVLAKSSEYFWDSAAFVEETGKPVRMMRTFRGGGVYTGGQRRDNSSEAQAKDAVEFTATSRNPRSVWRLSSEPTSVAHFATYPSELVRRCIQAGTSDGGCCPECGEPWAPVIENERLPTRPGINTKCDAKTWDKESLATIPGRLDGNVIGNRDPQRHCTDTRILGYRPTCECAMDSTPCRVLDPFLGIGTTVRTAWWMKRASAGIELNPEYVKAAVELVDHLEAPSWRRKERRRARRKRRRRTL
jgi:hypothetical protein